MKNISVFVLILLALTGCTITKKYHSFGYQIDWKKSLKTESGLKKNTPGSHSEVNVFSVKTKAITKVQVPQNLEEQSQKKIIDDKIKVLPVSILPNQLPPTAYHGPSLPIINNDTATKVKHGKQITIEDLKESDKKVRIVARLTFISLVLTLLFFILFWILYITPMFFPWLVFSFSFSILLVVWIYYNIKYLIIRNKYYRSKR